LSWRLLILFVWMAAMLVGCGGGGGGGSTPPPADKGRLIGAVLDIAGNGLLQAQVALQGTSLSASTTNLGTFEISDIPPGTYTVTAAKGARLSGRVSGVKIEGGKVATVQIVVATGSPGGLRGKVTAGGAAVAGADVSLVLSVDPNNPVKDVIYRTATAADGISGR